MKKLFNKIFLSKNVDLPIEGTIYMINDDSAYRGISGIVFHHKCKKRFMILSDNCVVTNLKCK